MDLIEQRLDNLSYELRSHYFKEFTKVLHGLLSDILKREQEDHIETPLKSWINS